MADFDPDLVSIHSVDGSETKKSVLYGDKLVGTLWRNDDGTYGGEVQLKVKRLILANIENCPHAANLVARVYWLRHDPTASNLPRPSDFNDRRLRPRIDVQVPVRSNTKDGTPVTGEISDLSSAGATLTVDMELEVNDELDIDIDDVIAIKARVVRKDGRCIGVKFFNSDRPEQVQIDAFLSDVVLGRHYKTIEEYCQTRCGNFEQCIRTNWCSGNRMNFGELKRQIEEMNDSESVDWI